VSPQNLLNLHYIKYENFSNWWSLKADVPQDKQFITLMLDVHNILKVKNPSINPETDKRAIYFK